MSNKWYNKEVLLIKIKQQKIYVNNNCDDIGYSMATWILRIPCSGIFYTHPFSCCYNNVSHQSYSRTESYCISMYIK